MIFKFSKSSISRLETVDPKLQTLAREVLKLSPIDFAITEGLRTPQRQAQLYRDRKTKTLNSKHLEGKAIDICPIIDNKLNYDSRDDIMFLAGLFYGVASQLNIEIRVGALWDNNSIAKNNFIDAYHIELKENC
jgi:peptidoglycan L-alanyl-D-glutamate endopeptidase CwlK